ncbi:hypothetical protein [Maribacter sp. 2210JD10-5]|uniref:hypothetical protein n=1 Tax=Maribacter sp. 2210JD10-5 TaxID=3386272 RepID=UPI0039BD3CD1
MKRLFFALVVCGIFKICAQTPTAGDLVKIHSVSNAEMNAIVSPEEGSLIFNTDARTLYEFNGTDWNKFIDAPSRTVILNASGGSLPTATNTFFNLPLDATDIQYINSNYFNVTGTSKVTILKQGNYMISGEISTTNMPSGDTKFILAVFINGIRRGYLSRGFASLPGQDFWGTTGVLMYALNANDVVGIQYVLNAGGTTLNANFSNIGITKL